MKKLIILCSLSMVLHFNLYAVHKPLHQRNHQNKQGPTTSFMQKDNKNESEFRTTFKPVENCLKKSCEVATIGGCSFVIVAGIRKTAEFFVWHVLFDEEARSAFLQDNELFLPK